MTRFKVVFRDRRIEIRQADRVVTSDDRVRLLDADGNEVDAWEAEEVASIQEVEKPGDRAEPRWSDGGG